MAPQAGRLLQAGRITSMAAVACTVFGLLVAAWIFLGHDHSDGLESFLFVTLISLTVLLAITGLVGPTLWLMGLRGAGGTGWQAVMVFVVMAGAAAWGVDFVVDELFRGLGNFF